MGINNIDLRHLRYFLAVAETLSFSRAAQQLHISQPPLSRQIADLEDRMETKLFRRTKRSVVLTEAGQDLVPRVKQILRDVDHGLHASRAVARGQVGEIRIATIYSAPLVPAFVGTIRCFRQHAPAARMVFREMRAASVIEAVVTNKADIGFNWQITPPSDKRLSSLIISRDKLRLFLPPDHRLARQRGLDIDNLNGECLFLTSLQMKMQLAQDISRLIHKNNTSLAISEEVAHFPIIANLIAAGCGMGFLPDHIAQRAAIRLVPQRLKNLSEKSLEMPLALIYRADNDNPFLLALIKACGKMLRTADK